MAAEILQGYLKGLGLSPEAQVPAGLATQLGDAFAAARAALPPLDAPDEVVAHLLGERVRDGGGTSDGYGHIAIADLILGVACGRGDPKALALFEQRTFVSARGAVSRVGLSAAERDEVFQILREKLFVALPGQVPRVTAVVGKGDLAALIRVMAVRTALNLRRTDQRLATGESMIELIAPDQDPELSLLKRGEREALKAAFSDALAALEPRERNLLRLHLLHDLSIDDIGKQYGVHRATAARWLEQLRRKLEKETRRLLKERHGLGGNDIDSLLRVAQSRVDMSFHRLLG